MHLCKDRKIINYNDIIHGKDLGDGAISSMFVGELEDAIQACDWNGVYKLMPSIYYVSDRSRSIIDTIADLGLQNIDSNVVMIFHALRAFNFTQNKSHVWTYACLLVNKIKNNSFPKPSDRKDCSPKDFFESIAVEEDVQKLVKYAAVLGCGMEITFAFEVIEEKFHLGFMKIFRYQLKNMKDRQIKNRQIDFIA